MAISRLYVGCKPQREAPSELYPVVISYGLIRY